MAGPYVRDTNAPDLVTGVTLNAAGSTTGTAIEVNQPGGCNIEVKTAAVTSTGNSATLLIRVEASDVSNFASKVIVAEFPVKSGSDASQSSQTWEINTEVIKRYMRAVVTIAGTAPAYTGTTIKVHPRHNRRTISTDTA